MDDLIQKEYEMLRKEIDQKMSLHNTLLTFTITSTVAVITIAVSENITILYLFPFCIIIPMMTRIAYYRKAMAKISAYMIVFLEPNLNGIAWETRNLNFSKQYGGISNDPHKFTLQYNECLIISIICYVLYLWNYIPGQTCSFLSVSGGTWPVLLIARVVYITYRINRVDKDRQEMVEIWTRMQQEENTSIQETVDGELLTEVRRIHTLLQNQFEQGN